MNPSSGHRQGGDTIAPADVIARLRQAFPGKRVAQSRWIDSRTLGVPLEQLAPDRLRELFLELEREFPAPATPLNGSGFGSGIVLRRASTVTPQRARFAYEGRIPLRMASLTVGPPDLGKTASTLDCLARITRGTLPGEYRGTPATVVILSAEDSEEVTLVPRLIAAGADLERVIFLEIHQDGLERGIALPADVPHLEQVVKETGAVVILLDPLNAYLGEQVNSWRDADVRRALYPLVRMADRTGCALWAIAHFRKEGASEALNRIGGSIAFAALMRSILVVIKHPDADEADPRSVIVHLKNNVGPKMPTQAFRLEKRVIGPSDNSIETVGVVWLGDAPSVTAVDVARSLSADERSALTEAVEFLEAELREGKQDSRKILNTARGAGISDATLRRAKQRLGVVSGKWGFKAGWFMELPSRARAYTSEHEHLRENTHLKHQVDNEDVEDAHEGAKALMFKMSKNERAPCSRTPTRTRTPPPERALATAGDP